MRCHIVNPDFFVFSAWRVQGSESRHLLFAWNVKKCWDGTPVCCFAANLFDFFITDIKEGKICSGTDGTCLKFQVKPNNRLQKKNKNKTEGFIYFTFCGFCACCMWLLVSKAVLQILNVHITDCNLIQVTRLMDSSARMIQRLCKKKKEKKKHPYVFNHTYKKSTHISIIRHLD